MSGFVKELVDKLFYSLQVTKFLIADTINFSKFLVFFLKKMIELKMDMELLLLVNRLKLSAKV